MKSFLTVLACLFVAESQALNLQSVGALESSDNTISDQLEASLSVLRDSDIAAEGKSIIETILEIKEEE